MDVLIIEDEIPAQQMLVRLLKKHFPEFRTAGILDSVSSASEWLGKHSPDLIFMDVELSDGNCFEIFRTADIQCPVIITTAYENYALDAFKAKCIDYLMKPVEPAAFRESVERCLHLYRSDRAENSTHSSISGIGAYAKPAYRHHITIRLGSQILVIDINDIAYFYSNDKSTWLVTKNGNQYMTDFSLVTIEEEMDPAKFYKISRKCIVGISSIYTISKYFNSRLKVTLSPKNIDPVIVPRERVQSFLDWIEGR